jgi:hypothetical protein
MLRRIHCFWVYDGGELIEEESHSLHGQKERETGGGWNPLSGHIPNDVSPPTFKGSLKASITSQYCQAGDHSQKSLGDITDPNYSNI